MAAWFIMAARFIIYRDAANQWRWRLVAVNGQIIAVSGEGFTRKGACRDSIALVWATTPTTEIEEHDGT